LVGDVKCVHRACFPRGSLAAHNTGARELFLKSLGSGSKFARAPSSRLLEVLKEARHLARADYIAMPWRNGAGITHEIAREPAHGALFSWRLSLASLQVNGPFSPYPGY